MLGKPLTKRENEYATLATSDLSFKQIGEIAGVTEETVKCALSIIYAKLGVRNRYGLIIHRLKENTADLLVEVDGNEDDTLVTEDEFLSSLPPGFKRPMKLL